MSIIEKYKRESSHIVQDYIKSLLQEEETSHSHKDNSEVKELIKEITSNDPKEQQQIEVDQEEQQFTFFANQTKVKQSKCIVCKKMNPKYTCPKCKVQYCSIEHFKSHNLFCSERFFKDQVESSLKCTKASKQAKKKMIEILKSNQEERAKDEYQLKEQITVQEISEERLKALLDALQNGLEVTLSDNETKAFQLYLKDISYASLQNQEGNQKQESKEDSPFTQHMPFWLIEEGLSLYYAADHFVEVQDYNQSKHKSILNYRQLAAQLLREDLQKLRQNINFKKTSVFINFDLFQFTYLTALLFRAFNGEYLKNQEFVDTFLQVYDQNFAKKISETYPSHLIEVMKEEVNIVGLITSNLSNIQNKDKGMMQIIQAWTPLVLDDCEKILQNKYICMEALLRLEESFKSLSGEQEVKWSDQMMQGEKKEKSKKPKQEKEKQKIILKIIKKIEFLLCFASEVFFREPIAQETEDIELIRTINNRQIIKNLLKRESVHQKLACKL